MNLDTIIAAAISLLGTLAGSYFANSKTIALLSYRLLGAAGAQGGEAQRRRRADVPVGEQRADRVQPD